MADLRTPHAPGRVRRLVPLGIRDLALLPAVVLLLVIGALGNPGFLTGDNLVNILGASSGLGLLVLAEAMILISGRMDLSLESIAGLAPALGFLVVIPAADAGFGTRWPTWAGLLLIPLVGAGVGAVNGALIVGLGLNGFIVTLAMNIVLRGVLIGLVSGRTLFSAPDAFFALGSRDWLGVPISVWLTALCFALAGFMLRYHRHGRAVYAIGGSAPAARAAGIRTGRVGWAVLVIGGALSGVAGLVLAGRVGALGANQGSGLIFTVFAAAVIGGISLRGGRGSLLGALLGTLLLGMLENLLALAQVSSFWIQAIYGGIILVALVVARLTTGEAQES
ncbi:ABC transporter permease [Streptomyces rapamycinicus]|uniref:ATPase n=2 Tax=Streptomyces rapamycinicus TaxID=1226757 RepID=A0A0A0NL42_STRRN|nr:ABC transporter permease [Streptomyces rapamycinicus]AGP60292.1 ATPase [Streptomyces rapamycinicus NRRL 5491]MBB4788544.1 simple sugar transport system permease protein [Streptomyces rapamycinicus]RLV72876.1 ATPase [Streptomyces rapamycinicus NRRL 5491]UTP35872.1 ABC transporter permease [Streptomyces rapamycinicus NRRL 5491]